MQQNNKFYFLFIFVTNYVLKYANYFFISNVLCRRAHDPPHYIKHPIILNTGHHIKHPIILNKIKGRQN